MIRNKVCSVAALAACLGLGRCALGAPLVYSTVAAYDENTFQANAVDAVAAGSNLTLAQFSADVAAAHAANAGGVVNFDDGGATPDTTGDLFFTANYGVGLANSLVVTRTDSANNVNNNNNNAPALSGSAATNANGNYLGFAGSADWTLAFSKPLAEWGMTAISRGGDRTGILTLNLSNSTSVVFPVEAIAGTNDDTLFAYGAPSGIGIVSASWNSGGSGFSRFDDMAFVVRIPEPTGAMLGIAALGWLVARRRAQDCGD